ncbi:hypothetical protein ASF53_10610 [Methylobacterium sp. Leaf123]|nr:hypothetical protein ASF53_10610 [Methylobacterium sp. Leaf123]
MFSKVFESVRARYRAWAEEEMLRELSDEALADIGLTRDGLSELRTDAKPVPGKGRTVAPFFATLAFPITLQGTFQGA